MQTGFWFYCRSHNLKKIGHCLSIYYNIIESKTWLLCKNDGGGGIFTGALLVVITITVECFSKWPEFWQALSLRACFENQCLFGSWNTPFFPKRPIHNYTRVWKNNRESVVHVISIDLLFIRDALGYNSECASSNKGFLMRWMVTVMPGACNSFVKTSKIYISLLSVSFR